MFSHDTFQYISLMALALAAWCDRQGEFMEYGGTISGEED